MPTRIAATLRRLHAGPRFRDDFDMFRLSRALPRARRRARHRDPGRLSRAPGRCCRGSRRRSPAIRWRPSRATTTCSPTTTSTTASGCGSSTTSTAATTTRPSSSATPARSSAIDDAQVAELCAAYFGEATPALLARMRLQMIMSDVGWTLWAAIQAAISTDRLRLRGLGRGALGAGDRDARRPRVRRVAGRRLTVPRAIELHTSRAARPRRDPVAPRRAGVGHDRDGPGVRPDTPRQRHVLPADPRGARRGRDRRRLVRQARRGRLARATGTTRARRADRRRGAPQVARVRAEPRRGSGPCRRCSGTARAAGSCSRSRRRIRRSPSS